LPGDQIEFWHGLWAPKGTPKDIIAKLNAAVTAAFADAGVRTRAGTHLTVHVFSTLRRRRTGDAHGRALEELYEE
jgi:tripartite-type tricarboxylate transporter receptor subunit TctC